MKFIGEVATEQQLIDEMPLVVRRAGDGCIGIWCITSRETGERLGDVFLLPLPIDKDDTDWDLMVGTGIPDCEIELGYILKPAAWGNGYASERRERLIRFAFEETPLSEVVAVIDDENTASRNVLLKTGFVEEGMRRAYAAECPGFRITREHWLEVQASYRLNAHHDAIWRCLHVQRPAAGVKTPENSSTAFVPPKANELLIAQLIERSRISFGV